MFQIDLRTLIGKLNSTTRNALEGATGLCLSRTHYDVELEHWLIKLIEKSDSDIEAILQHYDVNIARLVTDLTNTIDTFKTGNARPPALSPRLVDLGKDAWLLASLDYGESKLRSGHVLCAMLNDTDLARFASDISKEFEKISAIALRKEFAGIVSASGETQQDAGLPASSGEGGTQAPKAGSKTPALDQFTIDLTEKARAGGIDPVLGRDAEVRQMVDILSRRRQNNPIMTGEAGVGKTAVVEGFALRIVQGDIPPSLKNVAIKTLDLGLLQAGAGVKGEFENRLRSVIDEVKGSAQPIIMFIDEAHTLIGAGGAAGQGDAANLLKPALARGELRTIAATTWAEYKKYFEKDPALTRRFQVVKVEEPSEESAIEMMRGLVGVLEKHHKVRVLDEGVVEAVKLSHRYIPDRQMPDKCVSVLDTACARVAVSQSSIPASIEDATRQLEQLAVAIKLLQREMLTGADHDKKLGELEKQKIEVQQRLDTLNAQWANEKALIEKYLQIHARLERQVTETGESKDIDEEEQKQLKKDLLELDKKLADIQGQVPLMHVCVNASAIAEVIAGWTGIPVGRMVSDEIQSVLNLKDRLLKRVIGQDHALEAIAKNIRTSSAKLTDPNKPNGVFLMVGTSGVGKTETALVVADLLYGGEHNLTALNMSEFKEEHKVSLLMGSPPGYVGYGEGGVMTEAVRRKPYSVMLLDEMEKAHPGVQDIFYQVFDKGIMKDGEGRDIDFKNTVIIMTSNLGTETIKKLCADPETMPDAEGLLEAIHDDLTSYFKPAFLGRVNIIPYFPLFDDALAKIIRLKLDKIVKRVKENYDADVSYSDDLVQTILDRCSEVDTGARNIDHILENG
ncbi:MAG TPA: type VI secretion system ATPase TssH, partial [Gammaproteobacteria bacterium]|nr:type VI secretion system ATPase TssH [Gammaproteobacteria bacterium]